MLLSSLVFEFDTILFEKSDFMNDVVLCSSMLERTLGLVKFIPFSLYGLVKFEKFGPDRKNVNL